jgi:hypothetical protein
MRNSIIKITGIVLLLVMSMLCCSCATVNASLINNHVSGIVQRQLD